MHDVIIVGGGPAGMTAGIYLARAGYRVLILEKETIGGQIASSSLVENYPGHLKISGSELASIMYDQVINAGVSFEFENVVAIKNENIKKVITEDNEYKCKCIIIATGSKYRRLGLKSEERYIGNGIHFCVSCDGSFYKDKIVAVVGGANSAVGNAISLSKIAKKVYLIYRGKALKCEKELESKLNNCENIEVKYNTIIESFNGEENLNSIDIKSKDEKSTLLVDGLFEAIGMDAQSELIDNLLKKNDDNYIISNECFTEIKGIFVAGDCRDKALRQLTTATSDGALAANLAIKYLKK